VAIAQLLVSGDLAGLSDEQLSQLHRLISQLGGERKAISANETGPSSASAAIVDVAPDVAPAAEIPPVEKNESWL
jgi:hypothetical protein